MKSPSQIAADLRSLASKIERSNKPSKTLVASAIKRVLVAVGGESRLLQDDFDDRDFNYNFLSVLRQSRRGGYTAEEVKNLVDSLWDEEVENYFSENPSEL